MEGEDDAHEVTTGCVVTVRVTLTRNSLLDPQVAGLEDQRLRVEELNESDASVDSEDEEKDKEEEAVQEEAKPKRKPWEKQHQKKKAAGNKKKGKQQKKSQPVTAIATEEAEEEKKQEKVEDEEDEESGSGSEAGSPGNDDDSDVEDEHWKSVNKKVVSNFLINLRNFSLRLRQSPTRRTKCIARIILRKSLSGGGWL